MLHLPLDQGTFIHRPLPVSTRFPLPPASQTASALAHRTAQEVCHEDHVPQAHIADAHHHVGSPFSGKNFHHRLALPSCCVQSRRRPHNNRSISQSWLVAATRCPCLTYPPVTSTHIRVFQRMNPPCRPCLSVHLASPREPGVSLLSRRETARVPPPWVPVNLARYLLV